MGMHNFKELKIWQRSMSLAEEVYKITVDFPKEERYGLTSQLKSCAVSVPSNISEGAGRGTNKQFKYFLEISMGSMCDTNPISFPSINYITKEPADKIIYEVLKV